MSVSTENLPLQETVATPPAAVVTKKREDWADIAKAISIALVVLFHCSEPSVDLRSFGEKLIFLRLPLFFFVAGFFASKAVRGSWTDLFNKRLKGYLWVYALWSIVYLSLFDWRRSWSAGKPIDWSPLDMVTTPIQTVWFLYALAIAFVIRKALRGLPDWSVLLISLGFYAYSTYGGTWLWQELTLFDRVSRLMPFFVLGSMVFGPLRDFFQRPRPWAMLAFPLFLGISWIVYDSQALRSLPVVTAPLSFLGIFSILAISAVLARTRLRGMFQDIGSHTLHIYVLHRIVVWAPIVLISKAGFPPVIAVTLALLTTALGVWVPMKIRPIFDTGPLRWLFRPPSFARVRAHEASAGL